MQISTTSSQRLTYSPPSIWSLEGIPARPTPSPARVETQGFMTRLSGLRSSPLLSRFAHALFSERIRTLAEQMPLPLGGSFEPTSRLLGTLFCPSDCERVALGLTIDGIGCGCSERGIWRTLTAQDQGRGPRDVQILKEQGRSIHLMDQVKSGLLPTLVRADSTRSSMNKRGETNPSLNGLARRGLLPTLTRRDYRSPGTPERYERTSAESSRGQTLPEEIKALAGRGLLPTLTKGDSHGGGSRNLPGSKAHAGVSLSDVFITGDSTTPRAGQTGPLSPRWCEAYMGFPDSWTEPSE